MLEQIAAAAVRSVLDLQQLAIATIKQQTAFGEQIRPKVRHILKAGGEWALFGAAK
ncbi:hypothetical protein [Methylomonas albis]|uniref:Uncharacterized protein n=1 Tax=Methylomonas albis TaxID=1854563 RepID=A0ABR9CU92_9GAMM|nr:hypothetical protein [Methylomonas albis]MBD9354359.1 hypothetical protein [Methylomonas albis]